MGRLDLYDGMFQSRGYCDLAGGALGTWHGILLTYGSAEIPINSGECEPFPAIPHGVYELTVARGIEYELVSQPVDLSEGQGRVSVNVPLERAFSPEGTLSADLHVHSLGSNDSRVPRQTRVVTMLASGIQVIGSSDHNYNGDFEDAIAELGVRHWVASIPGNEVSAYALHFNVFPVEVDPTKERNGARAAEDVRSVAPSVLLDEYRDLPDQPIVILNHPRFRWAAYFDGRRWDGVSWPPPFPMNFDAVEILTAVQAFKTPEDPRLDEGVRDFYTFLANGAPIVAVGASDTHRLNGILPGIPRTYVFVDDASTDPFDSVGFISALTEGRAIATSGPWLEVTADAWAGPGDIIDREPGRLQVSVRLRQASFVKANRVRVWLGGEVVEQLSLPEGATTWDWEGSFDVEDDTWIGVDAAGDEPLPVELTGDYHQSRGRDGLLPFALINPIWVRVE